MRQSLIAATLSGTALTWAQLLLRQVRTCVMIIVHIKWNHPNVKERFSMP